MKATLLLPTLLLAIATTTQAEPQSPSARATHARGGGYTVQAGDTLWKIARSNGMTPSELAARNGLTSKSTLQVGQVLSLSAAARAPQPRAKAAEASTRPAASTDGYTVSSGDTLSHIARIHGTTVQKLVAANPGIKPQAIRPGQVVRIPGSKTATASIPSSSPQSETPSMDAPKATSQELATSDRPPERMQGESASTETIARSRKAHSVMIDNETTYGDFAAKYGTDTQRLNDLNGLDLDTATILAKGSELYVPAQP